MRRSPATSLLASALAIVAAGTACSDDGQVTGVPSSVTPEVTPSHAWDLNGDGDPAVGNVSLTFSGRHELAADAVSFDGAMGSAASPAPGPVNTTESFSIAAWVSLSPPVMVGGAEFAAAVSQLGDEAAAFYLGIAEGAWAFSMKDADSNESGHTIRALSGTATPDEQAWVHLVGVHDTEDGQIRLYLNGDPAAETTFTAAWQATGPLTVGRSQTRSSASDFWPGAIADVRVYATALNDRDVRGLADQTRPTAVPPPLPSVEQSALPNGTYEYTFTPEEAAEVISVGFSPEEAAQAGYPGTVSTSLRFQDAQWQQFFTVDGVVYTVNGQPEGDGGTFAIDGDNLILSNPGGDATYRWSISGDVLSLTLLDDPAGPEYAVVRLVTEHDYTLVAAG